jgi:exosortase/archaeosortase family protein
LATAEDATAPRKRSLPHATRVELLLRCACYVALVVASSNLLLSTWVDAALLARVRRAVAAGSGALLGLVRSDVRVADATVFLGTSAVEVVNGCTGVDVAIFLAAAMLVFPAPWRARALGVAAAFVVVLSVNFLRVLTLCWLNATSEPAFELVHYYVWPAFISLVCLATLLVWMQRVAGGESD